MPEQKANFSEIDNIRCGHNTEISNTDKSNLVVRSAENKNPYYIFLCMNGIIHAFNTILWQLKGLPRHKTECEYILKTALTSKQVVGS